MRETKYNQNTFNKKAPIDRDALWGKISTDPKFPQPELKSRKGFWIFGSVLFILLISALTYTFTKVESRDADEIGSTNIIKKENENILNTHSLKSKTQTTQDADVETTVKDENTKSITEINSNNEVRQSAISDNNTTGVLLSNNDPSVLKTEETTNLNKTKSTTDATLKTLRSNQSTIQTSTQGHSTTSQREFVKSENKLQVGDQNNTANELQTLSNQITALSTLKFAKLQKKAIGLPSYKESLIPLKSKIGLLIYLNASYGLSLQSVSAIDTLVAIDDIDDVSQYLENRESRAIEFGVKKQVFKRFSLGLGAEYREDWQVYKRSTVDTLVTAIPDEDGRIGLAEVTTNYWLPQSYKSLNLLVTAGYLIPTKIGILEIGGGLTYNVSSSHSGNILDREYNLIGKTRAYELVSFGLAGFGQTSLTLPLSEQLRLAFNARYDFPTLISPSDQSYEHRLSALRLGVGLGYAF